MPNHGLQCGVLVLQRPLGHHLILIMVHRQSLRHLLYVLPQGGDGLPYQQQHYQPDDWSRSYFHNYKLRTDNASSPKTQMPS